MLLEKFAAFIRKNNLFTPADKLILAVSGGVDSVVLCELCKEAGYAFLIAHCNFQLRGEESERDEAFVKKLGEKYGCEVLVKKFETEKYAAEKRISIQEAARNQRYKWFVEIADRPRNSHPEPFVSEDKLREGHQALLPLLTAHHADDNIETLLMTFFRGTGLKGMKGIPVSNDHIRRPLLPFFKEELIAYAKEQQLDWVEDASNQSSKYTRNFFRNEIIPAIEKVYPEVKTNLADNLERFNSIEKLYQLGVENFRKKLCKSKGEELHIPIKQVMGYNNTALIYELISPFGFTEKQVPELIRLSESESGKYIQSPTNRYRIIRHRHWFIVSPVQSIQSENIVINENDKEILFTLGKLQVEETTNYKLQTTNSIASLDSKHLSFPLLLRRHKTGDYFYPLGMKKKKKINRFLIDLKLSKTEKEKVWVIESDQRICWVVGYRIDERFKVVDNTKNVLRLEFFRNAN